MVKITYTRTFEDLINFNIFHVWKSPERKYFRLLFFIGMPFLLTLILFLSLKLAGMPFSNKDYMGFLLILAVLIFILYSFGGRLIQKTIRKKIQNSVNPASTLHLTGNAELTLTTKELRLVTPGNELIKPWSEVLKLRITKGYYFIYTDPMQAIVVPRRAFKDNREKEEFEKQLKKGITGR